MSFHWHTYHRQHVKTQKCKLLKAYIFVCICDMLETIVSTTPFENLGFKPLFRQTNLIVQLFMYWSSSQERGELVFTPIWDSRTSRNASEQCIRLSLYQCILLRFNTFWILTWHLADDLYNIDHTHKLTF